MRSLVFQKLRNAALGVTIFALVACAGTPMKGYSGPALPADQTTLVRTGPYTNLLACDGTSVPGLSVAVLPGEHTIQLKPTYGQDYRSYSWPFFFYSRVIGSLVFEAQAGHTYVANVNLLPAPSTEEAPSGSGFVWVGYIEDRTTHQRLAKTDKLPLEVEPRVPGGGFGGAHAR